MSIKVLNEKINSLNHIVFFGGAGLLKFSIINSSFAQECLSAGEPRRAAGEENVGPSGRKP